MKNRQLIFFSFFMFHTIFVYLDDGSGIGRKIQVGCLSIMSIYVFQNIKVLFDYHFKRFNIAILLFCITLLITSISIKDLVIGPDYQSSSYTLGIFHALSLIMFLVFFESVVIKKQIDIVLNTFFWLLFFYCIATDLFLLAGIHSFPEGFLIGNKFIVSYSHIFCVVLYCIKDRSKRINPYFTNSPKVYLFIAFSALICILSQTATGLIGSVIVFLLFKFKKVVKKTLFNSHLIITFLFIFTTISFIFIELINNEFIQYFIVNILGKDLTLTGRLDIYDVLLDMLTKRPVTGFGSGNAHYALRYYYGMANAQNGFFNVIFEQGILGATALVYLLYVSFRNLRNFGAYPLVAFIIMYIVLSSVEVTLGMNFIYLLIILQMFTFSNHKFEFYIDYIYNNKNYKIVSNQ
ncbi:MAG: O-antigen ligase family protein [Dysgonamonadaceae bacterium]